MHAGYSLAISMEKGPVPLAWDRAIFVMPPLSLPGEEWWQGDASGSSTCCEGYGHNVSCIRIHSYCECTSNSNITDCNLTFFTINTSCKFVVNVPFCILLLDRTRRFCFFAGNEIVRHCFSIGRTNISKVGRFTRSLQLSCEHGDCDGDEDGR